MVKNVAVDCWLRVGCLLALGGILGWRPAIVGNTDLWSGCEHRKNRFFRSSSLVTQQNAAEVFNGLASCQIALEFALDFSVIVHDRRMVAAAQGVADALVAYSA